MIKTIEIMHVKHFEHFNGAILLGLAASGMCISLPATAENGYTACSSSGPRRALLEAASLEHLLLAMEDKVAGVMRVPSGARKERN